VSAIADSRLTVRALTGYVAVPMAAEPKDQASRDSGVGCGCLLLVILLAALVAYRVFIYEGKDESRPQAAPTSTTLAPDEATRLGCWSWRHAENDGPYFSTKELPARMHWALQHAQESSVWEVAHAAEELQRAGESGTTEEHSTAWDAFKRACARVGE
jgi:hypothetical protein